MATATNTYGGGYYAPPTMTNGASAVTGGYNNQGSSASQYGTSIGQYQNMPSGISNAGSVGGPAGYVGQVQDDSLVQNQLQGLLANGSPYMDQARQAGINQANSRGLLNSSMAAGSSQAAAIQSALPIAQQDASTYNGQQLANQQSLNTVLTTGMQTDAQRAAAAASASAQVESARLNNAGALQRQQENNAYGGTQADLNRGFQEYMSGLGYQQQLGLNSFNLAGSMMQNNQNFRNQAGLQAMNNPFLLQDPAALGGYMDWIGGDYSGNIGNLINYSFGQGGSP